MAVTTKKYESTEVFMYKDVPYAAGAELELTEREAEFLLAQGKIKEKAVTTAKAAAENSGGEA